MNRIGWPKNLRNWLRVAAGYALLLIGVTAIVTFGLIILNAILALPKEIATPIIAGAFTVLVSVGSLVVSKQWERRRDIEQELRKQKLPVYEEFQAFWIKLLMQNQPGMSPVSGKELTRFFAGFTPKLLLWGSDPLLRRYAEFRRRSIDLAAEQTAGMTKESLSATLVAFEKVIYEMRSDLGHKNAGLDQGSLLRLFMSDLDLYMGSPSREDR